MNEFKLNLIKNDTRCVRAYDIKENSVSIFRGFLLHINSRLKINETIYIRRSEIRYFVESLVNPFCTDVMVKAFHSKNEKITAMLLAFFSGRSFQNIELANEELCASFIKTTKPYKLIKEILLAYSSTFQFEGYFYKSFNDKRFADNKFFYTLPSFHFFESNGFLKQDEIWQKMFLTRLLLDDESGIIFSDNIKLKDNIENYLVMPFD